MGDLPDLSRTSLLQLQQREMRGNPFRRPSNNPSREQRDCPAEDVLYVRVAMKSFTDGSRDPDTFSTIKIFVYQKRVPEEAGEPRWDWQDKQDSVVDPLLKIMRDGVENALRKRGYLKPIEWWNDNILHKYMDENLDAVGFKADFCDGPAVGLNGHFPRNARSKEAFEDMFAQALDYASGYPSRVVHVYDLQQTVTDDKYDGPEERYSQTAALCVGQGLGIGFQRSHSTDNNPPEIFGDLNATSDEEEDDE
jgi:hypothetical protein